jgi:hypothetical protein
MTIAQFLAVAALVAAILVGQLLADYLVTLRRSYARKADRDLAAMQCQLVPTVLRRRSTRNAAQSRQQRRRAGEV